MFYEDVMLAMCSNKDSLLRMVDEYTLYAHYLEYEPDVRGRSYPSPLRDGDDTPSFGVFYSRHRRDVEFMWKDHAHINSDGTSGISGDVFDLVAMLFGYTDLQSVFNHIKDDFKLGSFPEKKEKVIKAVAAARVDWQIAIKSRPFTVKDLSYWSQFNINREILQRYNTYAVSCFWMTKTQSIPNYPNSPCYAYRIWDRYQLYRPFEDKKRKFRNNWLELYVPGFEQLTYTSDLLVITKAYKDVMTFASFGYEAVASRGEDVSLPEEFMKMAKERYKYIVTWQDNDGKTGVEKYYPDLKHFTCPGSPATNDPKDPSDYCKRFGAEKTAQLLNETIWGYLNSH